MLIATTKGVKISVESSYNSDYVNDKSVYSLYHLFNYFVTIHNESHHVIQLVRRRWEVYDGDGSLTKVEGEGVVGQQPILEPGTTYQYSSGCKLKAPIGKMVGIYIMQRLVDGEEFEVTIPEFTLIAPYVLN